MPESRARSSVCAACTGRPRPRFEPPPTSSSGSPAASASATASRNSSMSAGVKRDIKKEVTRYRKGRQGYAMAAKSSERLRVLCVSFAPFALKKFLKPRQVGVGQTARVDMQPAQFGAAMQLREHLAGVEQPIRIEGAFEALLLGEVHFVEHRPHQVAFF